MESLQGRYESNMVTSSVMESGDLEKGRAAGTSLAWTAEEIGGKRNL